MHSPTQRFSDRVDFYVRSRPKYPAALLRFFQSDLGLSPLDAVADIGSGTGFLTEMFVRNGNPTFAVEPNEPMRKAAETHLGDWSNFHSINGTAEATTLGDASVRLVTAAQAFHWFDAGRAASEFRRILQPGGITAIIWNERLNDNSPFMAAYEQLIRRYRREDEPVRSGMFREGGTPVIQQFFGPAGYQQCTFENPQMLDAAGLLDRITSSSYMPLPSDPAYAELVRSATELFDKHQQNHTVRIMHETRVYYGTIGD